MRIHHNQIPISIMRKPANLCALNHLHPSLSRNLHKPLLRRSPCNLHNPLLLLNLVLNQLITLHTIRTHITVTSTMETSMLPIHLQIVPTSTTLPFPSPPLFYYPSPQPHRPHCLPMFSSTLKTKITRIFPILPPRQIRLFRQLYIQNQTQIHSLTT